MLIYSLTNTPRLQYIANFFAGYYKTVVSITTSSAEFYTYDGVRINYSYESFELAVVTITPVDFLFKQTISDVTIETFLHTNGYKAFFKNEGTVGFDLLAAVFYLLSRYEEYLPHQKDAYGRFAHSGSIAFKEGFLHKPLINIWLEDFRSLINQSFPDYLLPAADFCFIPTCDIDMAWSYKHKGFFRNAGGFLKAFLNKEWSSIKQRAVVLLRKKTDPYDAYDWMDQLHKKYRLAPVYFFHVGIRRNRYDKNIAVTNKAFKQVIKNTAKKYKTGLHPSWHSGDDASYITIEKSIFERLVHQKTIHSRQHFIRFTLPQTFRHLIASGITNDYSMGYGSINGFRASVASPFYWYDLERETETTLLLHPFCFMDANCFFEMELTANEAVEEMLRYYNEVKAVSGTFITIWHNTFLGTDQLFKGWREAYEKAIKIISVS